MNSRLFHILVSTGRNITLDNLNTREAQEKARQKRRIENKHFRNSAKFDYIPESRNSTRKMMIRNLFCFLNFIYVFYVHECSILTLTKRRHQIAL